MDSRGVPANGDNGQNDYRYLSRDRVYRGRTWRWRCCRDRPYFQFSNIVRLEGDTQGFV